MLYYLGSIYDERIPTDLFGTVLKKTRVVFKDYEMSTYLESKETLEYYL